MTGKRRGRPNKSGIDWSDREQYRARTRENMARLRATGVRVGRGYDATGPHVNWRDPEQRRAYFRDVQRRYRARAKARLEGEAAP